MKFIEIYQTQKTTRPVVICRLAWDKKNRRIIPLLNAGYFKGLFEDSYLNKVTKKRVHPTHSLKFLKSLHDCFLNLSYIRASKLKRIKGSCNPLKKVPKAGSWKRSFEFGDACLNVNLKEVKLNINERFATPEMDRR